MKLANAPKGRVFLYGDSELKVLDQETSLVLNDSLSDNGDPLVHLIRERFHLQDFRKGQKAIIDSVLRGRDALAVMPTGGGKSLCFQLPALAKDRLVLVISPLIALMEDQVRNLHSLGIRAGCLHSGQGDEEKKQVFSQLRAGGGYVLYLSPERVQKAGFATWLAEQQVALIAIDEAHCVSQWGPDFRLDYARLGVLRTVHPEVPILALTATATPQVLEEIVRSLGLRDPDRHVHGFYRGNLFYQVTTCDDDEQKIEMLKSAIRKTPEGRILIYCGTRQATETISEKLNGDLSRESVSDLGVGFYHAGLSPEVRSSIQSRLQSGELRVLVATNAFGMGINYPDVRLVAHYQMPANIESFYQEMGRAGRDGKMARCLLLYSKKDRGLQAFFIQQSKAEPRAISSKWRALDAMTQFAEGGECRHAGILTYFRDSERLRRCGHCDICAPSSPWVVPQSEVRREVMRIRRLKKEFALDRSEQLENAGAELRAEVLREWRRSFAAENDIAAFIVFSNRTLIDLANKNPRTIGDLKAIYGFGPHKIGAIGERVLAELRKID